MRSILLISCVVAGAASQAQTLSIPAGNNETQLIAAAEAEGSMFPRRAAPVVLARAFVPTPSLDVSSFENKGSENRKCVVGYEMGPIRSGEFVIGGQLSGPRAMMHGRQGKVWWAPLHHAAEMPPLVVRGRNLENPSDTVRFTSSNIAWPVTPGGPRVQESDREYFFPSGITIPTAGRWLLVATSGADWGCFILSVR